MNRPEVASRDCRECQIWQFDEKAGEWAKWRGGRLKRQGVTPCRLEIGCPKGTPERSRALCRRNMRVYHHYMQCKASGQFPDDAIVRKNAGIIRMLEDQLKFSTSQTLLKMLAARS